MKIFDWHKVEQLAMDLDVEEIEVNNDAPSYAEMKVRSENARKLLESGELWKEEDWTEPELPAWVERYWQLRDMGFSWRVATYIAWASTPKNGRWPETQADFAVRVLGLTSPRQITKWRKKDPRIDDAIAMMQAAPMQQARADVIQALIEVASKPDYKAKSDRKLFFEMTGDYGQRILLGRALDEEGAESLSEEELRRIAGGEYSRKDED